MSSAVIFSKLGTVPPDAVANGVPAKNVSRSFWPTAASGWLSCARISCSIAPRSVAQSAARIAAWLMRSASMRSATSTYGDGSL